MAKILLIDDSDTFRAQIKNDLSSNSHHVAEASNGRDGIEKVKESGPFDLIICDINMPELNGLEMIGILKDQDLLKESIIFMLTTETDQDLKEKGKALGVRAWITKPYKKDKLLAAIQKVT